MAARKAKRKYVKSRLRARPPMVRLRVDPQLTRGEVRQLQARAAADMRSVMSPGYWLGICGAGLDVAQLRRLDHQVAERRDPFAMLAQRPIPSDGVRS